MQNSTRAYRQKLLEWQMKRPRQSRGTLEATLHGSDFNLQEETFSRISSNEEDQNVSPITADTHQLTTPIAALVSHSRTNLSCACSCKAEELAAHFQGLLYLWDPTLGIPPVAPDLERRLEDGVDNILHCATRFTMNSYFYKRIFWHAKIRSGINTRDCDGMTALDIAVRTGNLDAIRSLFFLRRVASTTLYVN